MAQIKNIIFDLGGVLLNIDYNRTTAAFGELGVTGFDAMFSQLNANELFARLEKGQITEDAFYEQIRQAIPGTVSNETIDQAWNAMLLGFRTESLDTLERMTGQYRIFLLSNTNSIHLKCFREIFTRDTGKASIDSYFSKAWYSHLIGMRKPDKNIYEFALQDAGLPAGETIFIDDTAANINAAAQLGIHTHLMLPHERIGELGL